MKAFETITTRSGRELARGVWHNFGGPCSYRVASRRNKYSMRLDKTGEIAHPAGPAGRDAIAMALYRETRVPGYEHYCFGRAVEERAA